MADLPADLDQVHAKDHVRMHASVDHLEIGWLAKIATAALRRGKEHLSEDSESFIALTIVVRVNAPTR